MRELTTIKNLEKKDIERIFAYAEDADDLSQLNFNGLTAGCSFEGKGVRTRSTFLKALHDLAIRPIEIPDVLKTSEDIEHLAGYLDNWFDLYVIRESDHEKLAYFAKHSCKPVVNAMTSRFHPCEVLTDAFSIRKEKGPLTDLKYCLMGPLTNVFNSWYNLSSVFELNLVHVVPEDHDPKPGERESVYVTSEKREGLKNADVILPDAWPEGFHDDDLRLKLDDLKAANGNAWVIPCPPFDTDREISKEVIGSKYFAGYRQKAFLYDVHKAIVVFLLTAK